MAWTFKKSLSALKDIWTFGRGYRSLLVAGLLNTIGIVLLRLAMPWPLRGFIELLMPGESGKGAFVLRNLPDWGDRILWLSIIYVIIAVGIGIFEYYQRVLLKKYSAYTVHAMREACIRGVLDDSAPAETNEMADVISRLVGDSARIKVEMSGILVHVSQNFLLFIGICVVFFFISIKMALFFLAGGACATLIGYLMAVPVATTVMKQRKKEGRYAVMIHEAMERGYQLSDIDELNLSSRDLGVRTTRLMAISSLLAHTVLALITVTALWVIVSDVRAGTLVTGDLFLFIAYVLMVHRRMVRVGRQLARTGKAMANVNRLMGLAGKESRKPGTYEIKPFVSHFDLIGVTVKSGKDGKRNARLKKIDLKINAGEKIIITGKDGAGKSTLLQLLAWKTRPDKGEILWDEENVLALDKFRPNIAYIADNPVFSPTKVWKLLGIENAGRVTPEQQQLLIDLGAWKMISRLSRGIDGKVGSSSITAHEARALLIFNALNSNKDIIVLDEAVQGLKKSDAIERLEGIFRNSEKKTLIVSMSRPVLAGKFDRMIVLKNGKIKFDGTTYEWETEKSKED
jgi:ATP-binding cassette subfamily B protein